MRLALTICGGAIVLIAGAAGALYLVRSHREAEMFASYLLVERPYERKIGALPQTADSCATASGRWTEFGGGVYSFCFMKTRDAGRSCASSADCEALCIAADPSARPGFGGVCSDHLPQLGCITQAEGAQTVAMCRD